jgi:hypothetical protein
MLGLLCFGEVYYLHSQLSFIDKPYLYAGIGFLLTFLYFFIKQKKSWGVFKTKLSHRCLKKILQQYNLNIFFVIQTIPSSPLDLD